MIIRKGPAFVAIIAALTLSLSALGAGQRRNQQQQQQQRGQAAPQAPQPVGPKAASREEAAAFDAVQKEQTAATKVTLCDNFLTTYPNSQLTGYIQQFRMDALTRVGRHKEAVAAGEAALNFEIKFMEDLLKKADADAEAAKAAANSKDKDKDKDKKNDKKNDKNAPPPPPLDKNSPEFKAFVDDTERRMLYYYQAIMNSYQQLNDAPHTIEYAEKALGQDPENLLALLTLSSVMAERPTGDEKQKEEQMKRVIDLAKKADAGVNKLAGLSEEQKSSLAATIHSTMGLAYLNMKKYGDSEREYILSINAKKDDPVSYFRLGLAFAQDKRIDQALEALAKSAFLKGVTETQARDILKQLYEAKNKSSEGLEDFIKKAGASISQ